MLTSYKIKSLFDNGKYRDNKTWCITQIAASHSTPLNKFLRWVNCFSYFEKGHSFLIIETNQIKNEVYVFHYSTISPEDKKVDNGYAYLLRDSYERFIFKESEYYKKTLRSNKRQTWECDHEAANSLLESLNGDYEAKQTKNYSMVWENCHFLVAEVLAKYQERSL